MTHQFEFASSSSTKPNKLKNGDFHQYHHLEKDKIIIAALADGVGSSPCDWKASQVACEQFVQTFLNHQKHSTETKIKDAITHANKEVVYESSNCGGMKSTLCIVIWEYKKGLIYFVGVGDSRIYTYQENTLNQLTRDEVRSVILKKRDGKPLIHHGVAVVAEGVTNVIGSLDLHFEIQTIKDTNVQGIILASDGFYNCKASAFEKDMSTIFNGLNFQKELDLLEANYKDAQQDDMTLLAIRKSKKWNNSKEIVDSILAANENYAFSKLEISRAIQIELENALKNKETLKAQQLLYYCERNQIDLGQASTANLISVMLKADFQDSEIYQRLRKLLKASK